MFRPIRTDTPKGKAAEKVQLGQMCIFVFTPCNALVYLLSGLSEHEGVLPLLDDPGPVHKDRTPEQVHFERCLAYVVAALVLVAPLVMVPLNLFFAYKVYAVHLTDPAYPNWIQNDVYPMLDLTAMPTFEYVVYSAPFWLGLLLWAIVMTRSTYEIRASKSEAWFVGQWLVLYVPFALHGIAVVAMLMWGVFPD